LTPVCSTSAKRYGEGPHARIDKPGEEYVPPDGASLTDQLVQVLDVWHALAVGI